MRYRLTLAVALACAGSAARADGTDKNAYELFAQCTSEHSPFNQGVCLGYLSAVIDHASAGQATPSFCLPESFRLSDAVEGFVAYMDGNRSARSATATAAALASLERAYPCP